MKIKIIFSLHLLYWMLILNILLIALNACSGLSGRKGVAVTQGKQSATQTGMWTWVSGDEKEDQHGFYGTKGIAAAMNKPGGRNDAVNWIDSEDNLWLFGGHGYADKRLSQYLNDLWKFDGANWTWVSGDSSGRERGVYGAQGVAAETNKPGGRSGAVSWIDPQGNLWLFGGKGYAGKGFLGYLNDLWKFDGTYWTWVSGDNKIDQRGVYGSKGVAIATNKPGARSGGIGWIDGMGNLWLFGGLGYANISMKNSALNQRRRDYGAGYLNDLWKFDGENWTWVSGNNKAFYGPKMVSDDAKEPGARYGSVSWIDGEGNLCLFGGDAGVRYMKAINDLWKFDGTSWSWISGDRTEYQPSIYGTKGVPTKTNEPGGRSGSISWIGSKGNLWLFGGRKSYRMRNDNYLNDLWKFEP